MTCQFRLSLALISCCAIVTAAHAASPLLRSPWDGYPVKQTTAPYTCPAVVHIPTDLTTDSFYRLDDPTHSIVDPVRMAAYSKSAAPVKRVGMNIVAAADVYRSTGSHAAAECVIEQTVVLAHDRSFAGHMSSIQAYYVQGCVAGAIAIAWLKVGDSHIATLQQTTEVGRWLKSIGQQTREYYDTRTKAGDGKNNHLYWAGVELAAIAAVANDRGDFDWSVAAFDQGISQIKPDGVLPLEMQRGQRALHYHLYALAPLVMIAEFGEANSLDLYAHSNGAIHRLVKLSVSGLQDPSFFEKATGIPQEAGKHPSGDQIGWAPPYIARFPNSILQNYVEQARSLDVYYLGGLPPPTAAHSHS